MKGLGAAAVSAAVVMMSGGGAYAADLNNMPVKAVPVAGPAMCTSILDFFTTACQVAAYGVRFYGTIDVGASYETHGAPMNKYLGVNNFLGKMNNGARFIQTPNALSASNIGLQVKEPLGGGWSFVGQVEAGFNPYSMQLLNGVHSVFDSIHTPLINQTAFGDSNSQGTFYNDLGFTGISHDTWGTLTFFRQNDMMQDAVLAYDPMGVAGSFSPLGFFGSFAGGGDTQNRRDTTAIKYRVNVANWHFGAYGQVGGYDEGNAGKGGIQGDLGADYHVGPGLLSADVIGAWKKDAVSLGNGLVGPVNQFGYPINLTSAAETLGAVISNNTTVMAVAKYTVDRWRLYAGYEHIEFANPTDPQTAFTDIAGDFLCQNCTTAAGLVNNGTNINNIFYNVHKIDQLAWFGAKYSLTDSLDVTAAYYHEWQNDFSGGLTKTNQAGPPLTCAQSSTSNSQCAGTKDTVSILLDWKFAPKWDTYIGANYNANTGGDANGYLQKNEFSTTGGVRFRW
jgi:predicted porin